MIDFEVVSSELLTYVLDVCVKSGAELLISRCGATYLHLEDLETPNKY